MYKYSTNTNDPSQKFVRLQPNECVYVSYLINMPKSFERGVEATDELWTWLADHTSVTNLKGTLAGRYETAPWSRNYKRYKLLEKELEVFTQRSYGIPNNAWNYNRFFPNGTNSSNRLDDDTDNWNDEQSYLKNNQIFEKKIQLCFSDENDIPDQFILNYNNFNYESSGSFLVNVRKPNKAPIIYNRLLAKLKNQPSSPCQN